MVSPIEAVVYPEGNIRLFEDVHIPAPCRALVTILHEPPRPGSTVTILDEPPRPGSTEMPPERVMQRPVAFGSRIIDIAAVEELIDTGDHVQIYFESDHQPPVLLLDGDDAAAARQWMQAEQRYWRNYDGEVMTLTDLECLEALVTAGQTLSLRDCGQLLAEIRRIRANHDHHIRELARALQWLFHHLEEVQHALATSTLRSVRCTLGEGCDVRADGTCFHTDQLEGVW